MHEKSVVAVKVVRHEIVWNREQTLKDPLFAIDKVQMLS